jgi:hypothetical protein
MTATRNLRAATVFAIGATFFLSPVAKAGDQDSHPMGDHPAVVVQRLYKAAGYDYASKFYPHPAGLRLYAEPPRDETDPAAASALAAARPVPSSRLGARSSAAAPKISARSGG